MKNMIKTVLLTFVYAVIATGFSTAAHAGEAKILISASGIQYVTGGIGDEETDAMRKIAKDFTLNLVFSEGHGGKVTGVNAVIFNDSSERVFYIKGAKPLLYVDLPSGKYRVIASHHGEKQGYVFDLDDTTNKKLILNWKNAEELPLEE